LLKRRHVQEIDLGKEYQLVFELRPAHDRTKAYGFAGVVLCLNDLTQRRARSYGRFLPAPA
jgi:selenium-binding protein 1